MKRQLLVGSLALTLLCRALNGQSDKPVEELVEKVGQNVSRHRDALPDFVCSEKITSQALEDGKTTRQKVIESLFTGKRTKTRPTPKTEIETIVESRDVVAVDGKAVRKTTKLPDAPFLPRGELVANALVIVFADGRYATSIYDFTLSGQDKVRDLPVLRLDFARKTPLVGDLRITGTAWIDLQSMQVVRLKIQPVGFARSTVTDKFDTYTIETEYSKTEIGGESFWLPQSVKVEGKRTKNGNEAASVARYVAEYAQCRKFDVAVKIQ